ncbi:MULTISPECIES: sigma-70 family RNA polymerase sigma factor [Pedobacter]|uniref:RNA polymerase sigma factor n=1 Tax=Pedobacter zeae TaxID=1737356 RepID=A0A7W6KDB3_9SPHI|nr:sigma-70 family RNA polymerase sigma factor [Pedobacter zeae]MBB4109512.1 RNA polymerase sigma-70 factor (ECF subfamily) [Pedobacter zeae]GGH12661.1 RNA polymerase sigma factor [Pedobacter zeae]
MNYVADLASGCLQTFQTVYSLFNQKLYAYVLKKTNSAYMAEEVVQLTFIRLWEKRETLSAEYNISTQIFRIAGTILIDQLRKEAVSKKHLSVVEDHFALKTETEQPEMIHALEQAIEQMAPVRKKVFKMSKVEGYSYKEIAEMLSISPKTVENHISQALKQLRAAFSSIISLAVIMEAIIKK